jgi:hypothetical protein
VDKFHKYFCSNSVCERGNYCYLNEREYELETYMYVIDLDGYVKQCGLEKIKIKIKYRQRHCLSLRKPNLSTNNYNYST